MARRKARKSGGMKLRSCKRVKGGKWLCRLANGKVRFSKTKKF